MSFADKNITLIMHKITILAALGGLALLAMPAQGEEKIDFATQVYPFVKSGCVTCHSPEYEDERGRKRRPKAGIVLATKEGIMAEYELDSGDTKPLVIAGKPEESRMLEVTLLPIDDDFHFPPEGKAPQWTDAEKELFKKWIAEGADFGGWEADPEPREGLDWDGKEKEPGTVETAG